jgi:NADH-quinone oxidoreductase subunit G
VNSEGRAQRFFQVCVHEGDIQDSWRWLRDAMGAAGMREAAAWRRLDDVIAALTASMPVFEAVARAAPDADFRMAGARIPRAPHRYSGRTSMLANISVHEPKPPEDPDSALSFSMEGSPDQPPAALTPFFWAPGWNSIQAVNKYQSEIAGPLRGGDPGVRLIEPPDQDSGSYFEGVPGPFRARADEWLLMPLHHIFGSEELSRLSQGISELAPKPYLALNPDDAGRMRFSAGDEVRLAVAGSECSLPVKIEGSLPCGIAGIPDGLTALEKVSLPAWSRITRP